MKVGDRVRVHAPDSSSFHGREGTVDRIFPDTGSVNVQLDGTPLTLNFARHEVRPLPIDGTVCIWTAADTSAAAPTVDDDSATLSLDQTDQGVVLHIASDGPAGLWTVALTISPVAATELASRLGGGWSK